MKSAFSLSWLSSKQPRKQNKFRRNAPLHIRGKFLNSPLSKELRTKHNTRTLRVRKGDSVKVMTGQFKGKNGKVDRVDLAKSKIYVTNVHVMKKDGAKALYPINPSNVLITELFLEDKKRLKNIKKSD